MRNTLLGMALVVGLVAGAAPALADTMYWVEIEWTFGTLAGQTDIGSGTFDESVLTGVGGEAIGPDGNGSSILDGDLTFAIVVDGVSYTEVDDNTYPISPFLFFVGGVLSSGNFSGVNAGAFLSIDTSVFFTDAAGNASFSGPPAYSLTNPNPIPEPASLALVGLGAAGLAVHRRRKKRATA